MTDRLYYGTASNAICNPVFLLKFQQLVTWSFFPKPKNGFQLLANLVFSGFNCDLKKLIFYYHYSLTTTDRMWNGRN